MKNPSLIVLGLLAAVLCACQSTLPTVSDMDRFYKEAERRANVKIGELAQQRDSGLMSAEEFDFKAQRIRDDIPRKASAMAWTRHELAESEMRALGIPTGDHPVAVSAPQVGAGGSSFYHQPGNPTGNDSNGNQRVYSPPLSGYTPGQIAGQQGGLGAGF